MNKVRCFNGFLISDLPIGQGYLCRLFTRPTEVLNRTRPEREPPQIPPSVFVHGQMGLSLMFNRVECHTSNLGPLCRWGIGFIIICDQGPKRAHLMHHPFIK